MIILQTWAEVTVDSFQQMWQGVVGFLPNLIGALIIFLIGWVIAVALGKLVGQIIRVIKIDALLEKIGFGKAMEKAGIALDSGAWIDFLVKWFLIFAFLMAATDVLGLKDVTAFLRSVVGYVPNVIVAALILLVGVWAANFFQRLVQSSAAAGGIKAAGFSGSLVKWAILIFAILAALEQLGIAMGLIQTIITGLIAMLAIAGGIAFGLGGKEQAGEYLEKIRKEISD